MIKIDDETLFEFVDTKTTAKNLPAQLTIHAARSDSAIAIRKYTGAFPTAEAFEKTEQRAKDMTAAEVYAKFQDYCSNAVILQGGAFGVLTKEGHKALTSAPVVSGGKLMVTKEVLTEVLGEVNAAPIITDGIPMYDLAAVATACGKICTYDANNRILIIDDTGTVQYLNVPTYMNAVTEFFEAYYQ